MGEVYIIGTRTFAAEVADFARDAGLDVIGLLEPTDPETVGQTIHDLPVRRLDDVDGLSRVAIVGTGDTARRNVVERATTAGWQLLTLVHPHAHIARSATVHDGALVGPGVIVGACSTVGAHVVLGRGALVGHHTEIGPFATLGPGSNVAGNVMVESDVFVGMAVAVRDHVTIGRAATVAMGAVVVGDVPPGARMAGLPARPWRA